MEGPVATIVLARPDQLNAQTQHTWKALADIGATLPAETQVVLIRAEGRSFSAGLNRALFTAEGLPGLPGIGHLATQSDPAADAQIRSAQDGFTWLRRPEFVSVAAVQGHAVGAGFQLALACDLRILADDAQLCMAETSRGLVPDLAGTKALVEAVGYSRALEMCATGRWVGATEAAGMGLAAAVVTRAELSAATSDLVAALLGSPAGAVRELKALLLGAGERSHSEQEGLERSAQLRRLRAIAAGS